MSLDVINSLLFKMHPFFALFPIFWTTCSLRVGVHCCIFNLKHKMDDILIQFFQNFNAREERKKSQAKELLNDKESVISDSYGESFGDSHSPDPNEYYAR